MIEIFGDDDFGVFGFITVGGDFTTDKDVVGFVEEFVNERLFVLDFGTTNNHEDGMSGVGGGFGKIFDFTFDEEPGVDGEEVFYRVGRTVGAMNDGETVLNIKVGMSGVDDGFDKIGIVLFLAGIKAEIFEEEDVAGFHFFDGRENFLSGDIVHERNTVDEFV